MNVMLLSGKFETDDMSGRSWFANEQTVRQCQVSTYYDSGSAVLTENIAFVYVNLRTDGYAWNLY